MLSVGWWGILTGSAAGLCYSTKAIVAWRASLRHDIPMKVASPWGQRSSKASPCSPQAARCSVRLVWSALAGQWTAPARVACAADPGAPACGRAGSHRAAADQPLTLRRSMSCPDQPDTTEVRRSTWPCRRLLADLAAEEHSSDLPLGTGMVKRLTRQTTCVAVVATASVAVAVLLCAQCILDRYSRCTPCTAKPGERNSVPCCVHATLLMGWRICECVRLVSPFDVAIFNELVNE